MPAVDYSYLVECWREMGECAVGGMSVVAQPWSEVLAYSKARGLEIWESLTLRKMSCAYVDMTHSKKDTPCPTEYDEWTQRWERGNQIEWQMTVCRDKS